MTFRFALNPRAIDAVKTLIELGVDEDAICAILAILPHDLKREPSFRMIDGGDK